ncbi:hypothetical protein CROQUDRAFT_572782 [Cronartium quercuum f. sp. fusiforme G11]|uniref:Uncharacterized protein n=1 Tax=Cronartium quercuum f. sp. fusiforme G11 TaxID=708437 RepID=A0A9P6THX5_9BASI|nr:hypothetical protein CROQUDRAFT_572782 [Cronartium quercuum f. sp. fusiforme G11]
MNNISNELGPTLPDINHPKHNFNHITGIDDICQGGLLSAYLLHRQQKLLGQGCPRCSWTVKSELILDHG